MCPKPCSTMLDLIRLTPTTTGNPDFRNFVTSEKYDFEQVLAD